MNVASAQTRQYFFVSTPLNWTDAQSFCRQVYTDLATAESTADVSAVISTTSNYTGKFLILELYAQHIHTQDSGFLPQQIYIMNIFLNRQGLDRTP